MEHITINYAGRKVALRVYDWEREAMRKVARKLGVSIA